MRILLSVAMVLATMAMFTASSEAQYNDGYRFGAGVRLSRGFGRGRYIPRYTPREQLSPYFAINPPVYYNGIVKRPYGISPYAAPPGIAPVELSYPQPVTVNNPFFETEVTPVSNEVETAPVVKDSDGNKVTWQPNPYIESLVGVK